MNQTTKLDWKRAKKKKKKKKITGHKTKWKLLTD
jgi:hypothetical protein